MPVWRISLLVHLFGTTVQFRYSAFNPYFKPCWIWLWLHAFSSSSLYSNLYLCADWPVHNGDHWWLPSSPENRVQWIWVAKQAFWVWQVPITGHRACWVGRSGELCWWSSLEVTWYQGDDQASARTKWGSCATCMWDVWKQTGKGSWATKTKTFWSDNNWQWMIVAGGLNGKEEVLSSVEIIQHSDGALQVGLYRLALKE